MGLYSIRTYLLVLVAVLSVSLTCVVGFSIYSDTQQTVAHTKASLRSLVTTMVTNTGGRIEDARMKVELLATRPLIKRIDPKNCDPELPLILTLNPGYTNVSVTDMNGLVVCSAVPQPGGKLVNIRNAKWFHTFSMNRRFTVGTPFFGPITGKWVSVLSQPIFDERREMIGGVQLSLDLKAYDPNIPAQFLPPGSRYGFQSEDGVLLWRNTDPEGAIGSRGKSEASRRISELGNGEFESVGSDGVKRFYSVMRMPEIGWIAFIGVPTAEVYATAKSRAITASTIAFLAIVTLIILALAIARRIVQPISELGKAARSVASGNTRLRVASAGPREIYEVASSFNNMVDTIEAGTKELVDEIRERKKVEASLTNSEVLFHNYFDQGQVGMAITSLDQKWLKVNTRLCDMLGYSKAELTEKTWTELTHPDDLESDLIQFRRLVSGEIERYELDKRFIHRRGNVIHTHLTVACQRKPDGSIDYVFASLSDITERKRHEGELETARKAANTANITKSRFLATMSHEIRTPMNGILGMAQMLLMPDVKESERLDYTRTILTSGQTLLTLLNDILDLSRVESGKFELESTAFEPEKIIHEEATLFSETAKAKGLQVDTIWHGPTSQRYLGDPHRVRQMLSNLVGNAIKFSAQGGIRIEAHELERDEKIAVLEFAVADKGIGIPKDKQTFLFQPFTQADSSTTREYGGSGLGLSIVKSLAGLMGGDVGIESEVGQGSRFWFRIRAGLVSAGMDSRVRERAQNYEHGRDEIHTRLAGRVLVVEDDRTNRKVIEALLSKLGLTVVLGEDGKQAVELLERGELVDLVLMDIQMPVMDGYEATSQIRQREKESGNSPIPIIALTANAFEEDRQRCLAAGMDDYVSKPIAIETLKAVVSKWLPAGNSSV